METIKPFLSDKVKSKETIILVNNDNVESKETEVAKPFNDFFSNIVKNLNIPEYKCEVDLHNRLSGSSMKVSLHQNTLNLSNNSNLTPAFKQRSRNLKDNYRPVSILPIISKILNSSCANNFQIILITYFQSFNVIFERDLVRSFVFF